MTAYRFRVKPERTTDPFWRDVVVGSGRTLDELYAVINDAVGLDGDRLWFFGTDRDYWESAVKYQSPHEYEDATSGGSMRWDEDVFNAAETTIGEFGLDRLDRFCYLYDYVTEWRFYAIVQDVDEDESDDQPPEVVEERGDPATLDWRRVTR